ncbi:MAG TPA: DUF4177 domain-containing protein [Myxococcota bacterium]|nr:DUF4177 domain-containing protein [Myxococcota bacterium]
MSVEYKIVEISTVTDETIEAVLNEWVAKGWIYDGLQFAMRESSPRPSMAFVTFKRESGGTRAD